MGREAGRLNALAVRRIAKPGRYADGAGLYLVIASPTSRKWMFRYQRQGGQHWMGLGPERDVTLAEARQKARDAAD